MVHLIQWIPGPRADALTEDWKLKVGIQHFVAHQILIISK